MRIEGPYVPAVERIEHHGREIERFQKAADEDAKKAHVISIARLASFLGAVILIGAGFSQGSELLLGAGGATSLVFFFLVAMHATVIDRERAKLARRDVHDRHKRRLTDAWQDLPTSVVAPEQHPYAGDIDLFGPGSLMQRVDTTHTLRGETLLAAWLCAPAPRDVVKARQAAVRELSEDEELCRELEVAGRVQGKGKLDAAPFLQFIRRERTFRRPWLMPLIHLFPLTVLGLFVASHYGLVASRYAWIALLVQTTFALAMSKETLPAFELIAARRGYVEAFARLLKVAYAADLKSPLLLDLKRRVAIDGRTPSAYMGRLDRWAGFAEFYTQFPVHFFVNIATLWDLHVLYRLERWTEEIGGGLEDALDALAELEALASFASLLRDDDDATLPSIEDPGHALSAEGLAHPLLPSDRRVANDFVMPNACSLVIVTGSNMAGKSTLLRSVGLSIALTFAGGPVLARELSLAPMRLRASMRVDDDLQRGASYFHAELQKLRTVVAEAEAAPPLFFLLDELLRGTNARARHIGARAVIEHLLDRGGAGITATHDIALSKLEDEREHIRNVHFTDVMRDGEMLFDYTLRDGVVKTSNALRLLGMAGIAVPDDDSLAPISDAPAPA